VIRTEIERVVQPSLLDRLTDTAPMTPADPPTTRESSEREFRESVQRDLEWLLNTRRAIVPVPENCPEVHRSAQEYGLPDTTGIAVGTEQGRRLLLEILQDTIERFEPRLGSPRVRLVDVGQHGAPRVRFTVEASLRMDPSPEHVVFDTVLEVARGEYEVREGASADVPPET
jgi:type VI secretion system protein ImpF